MSKRQYVKIFSDMADYLGLISGDIDAVSLRNKDILDGAAMHCLYLVQDIEGGCEADCAYCTQSSSSKRNQKDSYLIDKSLLRYPLTKLISIIEKGLIEKRNIRRICFSSLHNKNSLEDALDVITQIRAVTDVPITALHIPEPKEGFEALKKAGADRIGVALEVAEEKLFEKIRGKERQNSPYSWDGVQKALDAAIDVFGKGNVGTHLLIGLGETQEEAARCMQDLYDRSVDVSLFSFCPAEGTDLENHERPTYQSYHAIQIVKLLMMTKTARFSDMSFDSDGNITDFGISEEEFDSILKSGKAFRNIGGCPDCNRIYYETSIHERYYNFPRDPKPCELEVVAAELKRTH